MYRTTIRIQYPKGDVAAGLSHERAAEVCADAALMECDPDFDWNECLQSNPGCGSVIVSLSHKRLPGLARLIGSLDDMPGRVELYTTSDEHGAPGGTQVYSLVLNGYAAAEAVAA